MKATNSNQTVSPETPEAKHQVARHASLRHSPALILIVADDQNLRDSLAKVLRAKNYAVRVADDGDEAVWQFLQGPPDLVILDFDMPNLNSCEGFQIMIQLFPYLPVIVISARPDRAVRAAEAGIDMLLEKPLDIPSFLESLRKLLAQPETAHFDRVLHASRAQGRPASQG